MSAYLIIVHVCIIVLSNILVSIPISFFGFKVTLAAFSFPLVIVATDLTTRLLGKYLAQVIITYSFPFAVLSSIIILYYNENHMSLSIRIGLASAIAYALGILIDINAFQFIREKYSKWWIAPALSTVVSNIIDSYTFFFSAFYKSEDYYMSTNWLEICITQTVIKIIIGFLFFLPLYGVLLNLLLKKLKITNKNQES